ncbi:MAG: hypothetical protein AAGJ46_15735 [Planctomycetota bacterium]
MAASDQQHARGYQLLLAWAAAAFAACCLVDVAHAQRVQIPTPSTGVAPPPTAIQPGFSQPALSQPGFGQPGAVQLGPPPTFDSYAGSGAPVYLTPQQSFVAPPATTYGQPIAPDPAFANQSPAPLAPGGLPFAWESGTYELQGVETSGVRFTKFLQRLDGEYTHLFGGGSARDLELNRVEVSSTFAWPLFGNLDTPLLLTPAFVYNNFDDSEFIANSGFPDETFEAYLDAAWLPVINEWLTAELGIRTGVWTDFDKVNSDAVRVLGRGVAAIRFTPRAELMAGAVYLDRERVKLLPVLGVRWRPSPDLHIEAVFPSPVARKRLNTAGTTDWWMFVAGEYGGGSWVISEAPTGFDYNDLRVSVGLEFETQSRVSGRFEVGYVFEREFYLPGAMVREFEDTVMLRAGINL